MAYIGPSFIRANKGDLVVIKFTLTVADVPTNLTTPTLSAYEEGNATEFTGGITLTAPYDSKVGLNELQIDTSDAAYTAGKQYAFVFTAGTIGAVTLVGTAILNLALIPEPADLRAVNGGSTGATAGKLELAQLKITATGFDSALSLNAEDGDAADFITSGTGDGIFIDGGRVGITIQSEADGRAAIEATAFGSGGVGALLSGTAVGGSPGGGGYVTLAGNNGAALVAEGAGTLPFTYNGIFVAGKEDDNAVEIRAIGDGRAINVLRNSGVDTTQPLIAVGVSGVGGAYDAVELWNGASTGSVGLRIHGLNINDNGSGGGEPAVEIFGQDGGVAVLVETDSDLGGADCVQLAPSGTGKAINAQGQVLVAPQNTDDSALVLTPNGAGLGIDCPVETGADLIQSLMLSNSGNAGKTNGMGTATAHLRDLADTKNRVTAQVDSNGNRTSVTRDLT